jgi:hypothetical protein
VGGQADQVLEGEADTAAVELFHLAFDGAFPGICSREPIGVRGGNGAQDPAQAAVGPVEDLVPGRIEVLILWMWYSVSCSFRNDASTSFCPGKKKACLRFVMMAFDQG